MAPSSLRCLCVLCVPSASSALKRCSFLRACGALSFLGASTHARWRPTYASRALLQLGANGAGDAIRLHRPAGPRHLLARHAARSYGTRAHARLRLPHRRQHDPDARAYEPVSFTELRALAEAHDITRLAIETRKDQIEKLDWAIKSRDARRPAGDAKSRADRLAQFWRRPDGERPFATWLHALLEDLSRPRRAGL